jgi:hypothetical protein
VRQIRMNGPLNIGARLHQRDEKMWQHEEAYVFSKRLPKMVCYCNFCHGGRTWPRKVVQQHLNTYSHDPTLHNAKLVAINVPSLFHQNKVMFVVFSILNKCKRRTQFSWVLAISF